MIYRKWKPRTQKVIDPVKLEDLFASGLSQAEVSKACAISYAGLVRKIVGSLTLQEARRKGLERAKG